MRDDRPVIDGNISYNADYKVLICRTCSHAVKPGDGIKRHFKDTHSRTIDVGVRKLIFKHAKSLSLSSPEEVPIPPSTCPPIDGISLLSGWSCDECGHVCPSERSMQEHCRVEHKWVKSTGQRWRSKNIQTFFQGAETFFQGDIQTFFQGADRRYFVVTCATKEDRAAVCMMDDWITGILEEAKEKDAKEDEMLGIVDLNQHTVDKSPWMRRTGWLREFSGKDMDAIVKKSWRPAKEEAGLQLIWKSVGRVLDTCVGGVVDCTNRNWRLIAFWLNGSNVGKADSKPFNMDKNPATIKRYKEYWQRLICYCIRTLGEEEECGIQFLPDQDELLNQLKEMAEGNEEDEEAIDSIVLKVSALFIMHSDYAPRRSVLVHFFGVLGYDGHTKRWREPNTYTPILAGIQFCLRVLMLEYSLPSRERNEVIYLEGDNPLEVFRRVRDKWLVDGEATPFNTMHKLLQYGMQVGLAAGGRDRVLWSEGGETMYFDGRPLRVEGFRQFIHSIIEAAERVMCESLLFGDTERMAMVEPPKLRDDVNVPNVKHSFVSVEENGLSGGQERMLRLLKSSYAWKKMLRKDTDGLHWIASGMGNYASAAEMFLEYLLILIHVTGGQPRRGTEITTLRYANAMQSMRNIFIKEGQVMIVTEYHKSMAVMDQLKVIPRFLPDRVGKLLVIYLADVLPFRQLMDRKAAMLTSNGFLWFKNGKPWGDGRPDQGVDKGESESDGVSYHDCGLTSYCCRDRSKACPWVDARNGS